MAARVKDTPLPPTRRRSRHDLQPGESPLKVYEGWQHFWLFGVRHQTAQVGAFLARRPYLYPLVALGVGVALGVAGLLWGGQGRYQDWVAPALLGGAVLCLLFAVGGFASALAARTADKKEGEGEDRSHR
jgi:hypothetical protein